MCRGQGDPTPIAGQQALTKPFQWTALSASRMVTVCAPALGNVPTVLCPPACSLSSPAPRRRVTAAAELLPFFVSSYLFASWYAREPLSCGQRCDDPPCHLCRLQRWVLASSTLSGVPLQWPGLHSHRSSCPSAERARNALLIPASVILSCLPWSRCVRRPLSVPTRPVACPCTRCAHPPLPVAPRAGGEAL